MVNGQVVEFPPDGTNHQADGAHDDEYVLPAVGVAEPSHDWGEDSQRQVLRAVEDGAGNTAFGGGEPCGNDAARGWSDRRLSSTEQKAQGQ
ncbi:hypothetical protein D3C76_1183420 [compost metagenome]